MYTVVVLHAHCDFARIVIGHCVGSLSCCLGQDTSTSELLAAAVAEAHGKQYGSCRCMLKGRISSRLSRPVARLTLTILTH